MDMISNLIGVSISKIAPMKLKSTFGSTFKTKSIKQFANDNNDNVLGTIFLCWNISYSWYSTNIIILFNGHII